MNGHVDSYGRALLTVSVRPSDVAAAHDVQVWIDTGFNGDLVLPQQQINAAQELKHQQPQSQLPA
jgi:predicted aspartyl protease